MGLSADVSEDEVSALIHPIVAYRSWREQTYLMTGRQVPGTPRSGTRSYRCAVCDKKETAPRPSICHGRHMSEVKAPRSNR